MLVLEHVTTLTGNELAVLPQLFVAVTATFPPLEANVTTMLLVPWPEVITACAGTVQE